MTDMKNGFDVKKALKDKIEREAVSVKCRANKEKELSEVRYKIEKAYEVDTNERYDTVPKENFVGYFYGQEFGQIVKKVMKGVYRNGQLVIYTFNSGSAKKYTKLNNVMPPHNLKRGIVRINIDEVIKKVYKV